MAGRPARLTACSPARVATRVRTFLLFLAAVRLVALAGPEPVHVWVMPSQPPLAAQPDLAAIRAFVARWRPLLANSESELESNREFARDVLGQHLLLEELARSPWRRRVRLRYLSWDEALPRIRATARTADAPDLVEIGTTWLAKLAAERRIAPLSDGGPDRYAAPLRALSTYRGAGYGALRQLDVRLLFFRRDLATPAGEPAFDAEPWADLAAFEQSVTRLQARLARKEIVSLRGFCIPDHAFGLPAAGPNLFHDYSLLVWAHGGRMFDVDTLFGRAFEIPRVVFDSDPGAKQALALLCRIRGATSFSAKSEAELCAKFVRGRIGAVVSGCWLIAYLREQYGEDWTAFAAARLFPGARGPVTFLGGSLLAATPSGVARHGPAELSRVAAFFTTGPAAACLPLPAAQGALTRKLAGLPASAGAVIHAAVAAPDVRRFSYPASARLGAMELDLCRAKFPSLLETVAATPEAATAQLHQIGGDLRDVIEVRFQHRLLMACLAVIALLVCAGVTAGWLGWRRRRIRVAEIMRSLAPCVCRISTAGTSGAGSYGTGFCLDVAGQACVVTCAHVLAAVLGQDGDAPPGLEGRTVCAWNDRAATDMTVRWATPMAERDGVLTLEHDDFAVLSGTGPDAFLRPLGARRRAAANGLPVFLFGYETAASSKGSMISGHVVGGMAARTIKCHLPGGRILDCALSDLYQVRLASPVSGGLSGAPVVDSRGRLIGVFVGGRKDDIPIGIVLPSEKLARFCKGRPAQETNAPAFSSHEVGVGAHRQEK
ncbi:MAG: extracellular solute-binding protein [Kiritimatiellae bacterium]|nr:extracellular solute-binding protein [Kiritimatiellia bacterium]